MLKPWLDSPEKPNLFSFTATKLACRNDGEGNHVAMCRSRQLTLGGNLGCESSGAGACWQTVEGGW